MQEHFSAGAWTAQRPQNETPRAGPTRRKCRSIFRRVPGPHDTLKSKRISLSRHAENAGAFFGGCLDRTTSPKRNATGRTDTPKMQEHFSAGAWTARHPKIEAHFAEPTRRKCRSIFRRVPGPHNVPKTKRHGPDRHAENAGAFFGGCLDRTTS